MQISAQKINEILFREDIEGFIQAGAPDDEYQYEANQIAAAILLLTKEQLNQDSILSILSVIWMEYFEIAPEELQVRLPAFKRVADFILLLAQ